LLLLKRHKFTQVLLLLLQLVLLLLVIHWWGQIQRGLHDWLLLLLLVLLVHWVPSTLRCPL
jgi:hypothetical protein